MQAIEVARRRLIQERIDIGVALDPLVVEVDREDMGATLLNRFYQPLCSTATAETISPASAHI
jgi:hypothetical protein